MKIRVVLSIVLYSLCVQAASLKTLKNKNGFSFSYPSTWKVEGSEACNPDACPTVLATGPMDQFPKGRWMEVGIGCFKPFHGKKVEAVEQRAQGQFADSARKKISERNLKVGGESAIEVGILDESGLNKDSPRGAVKKVISFNHGGQECRIFYQEQGFDTLNFRDDSKWTYKKEVEQIISSFSFTGGNKKK